MSRFFWDAIGLYNLQTFDMFQFFNIQEDDLCKTLRTIIIFLIGSSYAWLISNKEVGMQYFESSINKTQALNKLIKVLFYIYFVIFLAKLVYIAQFVASRGYLSLFTGELSEDKLPIIFTGSGTMTEILFALILFYNREKNRLFIIVFFI